MPDPRPLLLEAAEAFIALGGYRGAERRRARRATNAAAWSEATRAEILRTTGTYHAAEPTPPGPDDPDDEPADAPTAPRPPVNGQAPRLPSILITFEAAGSAGATITPTADVTLGQLMAAAFLIDCVARELRAAQVAQAGQRSLLVPSPGRPVAPFTGYERPTRRP
jgi:hypothetical protein